MDLPSRAQPANRQQPCASGMLISAGCTLSGWTRCRLRASQRAREGERRGEAGGGRGRETAACAKERLPAAHPLRPPAHRPVERVTRHVGRLLHVLVACAQESPAVAVGHRRERLGAAAHSSAQLSTASERRIHTDGRTTSRTRTLLPEPLGAPFYARQRRQTLPELGLKAHAPSGVCASAGVGGRRRALVHMHVRVRPRAQQHHKVRVCRRHGARCAAICCRGASRLTRTEASTEVTTPVRVAAVERRFMRDRIDGDGVLLPR